jgi:hypothetical protein
MPLSAAGVNYYDNDDRIIARNLHDGFGTD